MTGSAPPLEPEEAYPRIPPPPPLATYPESPGGVYPPPYSPEARVNDTSGHNVPAGEIPSYPANTKIEYGHPTYTTYTKPHVTSKTEAPSESKFTAIPISTVFTTEPELPVEKYWGHFGLGVLFGFFFTPFSFCGLWCVNAPRPKKYYASGCAIGLIGCIIVYVIVWLILLLKFK